MGKFQHLQGGCLIEMELFLSLNDYEKEKSDSLGKTKMSDVIIMKLLV